MCVKRQKNGTGTFKHRKRKDGTEYVEYRVYMGIGADGKPWRPSFYGDTEKLALQARNDWEKNRGKVPIERVKTVSQWADKWLELYKKPSVEYSTYRNYQMYVENHIKPKLGALKLEQVRPAHIKQFLASLPVDMSQSAKRHINIALNGIFKSAVENHFCSENPVRPMPMPKADPEEIEVFTPEEISRIMERARTNPHAIYVLLPLYTGMRLSEMSALIWPNVDYKNGQIIVRTAMTRKEGGGYEPGPTKGKKTRVEPLDGSLLAAMQAVPVTGMYVLPGKNGEPMTPHQFEGRYKKFFKDSGIRYLTPHKCRHTYATYLIRGGADLRAVQKLLGHAHVVTTEIYTHVNLEDLKNNVKKLGY